MLDLIIKLLAIATLLKFLRYSWWSIAIVVSIFILYVLAAIYKFILVTFKKVQKNG